MAWQPQEGPILELAGYLKDSLGNPYDVNAQKRATEVCLASLDDSLKDALVFFRPMCPF